MRHEVKLKHGKDIITSYRYPVPFHLHLKQFFRQHKQFGSRDRKFYSALSYAYFRTGKNFTDLPIEDKLVLSFILSDAADLDFISYHLEKKNIPLPAQFNTPGEKIIWIKEQFPTFDTGKIFHFKSRLSKGVNKQAFILSHLQQPYTWIYIMNGKKKAVMEELKKVNIEPLEEAGNALGFAPATSLVELQSYKKGFFEIQDLSSQKTATLMEPSPDEYWWDCCAGSGGKSILLKDKEPGLKLLVSDIRESILQNLEQRFKRDRIRNFQTKVIDLEHDHLPLREKFDNIIIDAPCTGSGTWSRNPEHLLYFDVKQIEQYMQRQIRIACSAAKNLKSGGKLIYITCSVFMAENEAVVEEVCNETGFQPENMISFEGYHSHSDNIFATVMIKKSG